MRRGGRGAGGANRPAAKDVEVSGKHLGLRIAATVFFIVVAVAAFATFIKELVGVDEGWQAVQPSGDEGGYGAELVLNYNIGASVGSAKAELRGLKSAYAAALAKAGAAFDARSDAAGSLGVLNGAPNKEVSINSALYSALELLDKNGCRTAFLGPAFDIYDNIFFCGDDAALADFDPESNETLLKLFADIAAYAADPDSVGIKLLGGGKAMLCVSEEYLSFLEEEQLSPIVDFYWMKNAFLVDAVADSLIAEGYTCGTLTSGDGYARNLGAGGEGFSLNVFSCATGALTVACRLDYTGPAALVTLRRFPVGSGEGRYFYVTEEGAIKHRFLGFPDALPHSGAESLAAISKNLSCAEVAIKCAPLVTDGGMSSEKLAALAGSGVDAVWPTKDCVYVTSGDVTVTALASGLELKKLPAEE